jgi:hypothetical protein
MLKYTMEKYTMKILIILPTSNFIQIVFNQVVFILYIIYNI